MMTHDELLTIQQAAEQTGLSVHTLRYYERIGLLMPVNRAANGHRRYSQADLNRIAFLNKVRKTGMSIRKLLEFSALYAQGDASIAERIRVLEEHRQSVLDYIAGLEQNLSAIEYKIDLYKSMEQAQWNDES